MRLNGAVAVSAEEKCDPSNQITEETIHQLYEMAIGAYLPEEDRLLPGHFYRHDSVYVVGVKVEHTGFPWSA